MIRYLGTALFALLLSCFSIGSAWAFSLFPSGGMSLSAEGPQGFKWEYKGDNFSIGNNGITIGNGQFFGDDDDDDDDDDDRYDRDDDDDDDDD